MVDQSYEMFGNHPESFKKLNPHLFKKSLDRSPVENVKQLTDETLPRASTDENRLNKTEKAFLAYRRSLAPNSWIGIQCLTLKLADDTRYTPDFVAFVAEKVFAYEVKGFFRDDAKVKIKVAARMFPWIQFTLVFKDKSTGWKFVRVKP